MNYRPEIDGLRAIAVLPVLFFHANLPFFTGGFVGVDVFFVISGYLITSIILTELNAQNFSLISFYERRIRRVFPALYLVVLTSIPFAWWFLLPKDMQNFAESVVSIPLFLSNFLFESQSGYFDPGVETKPLIHTWSLAVEEQYYLLFPALMIFFQRYSTTRQVVILTMLCMLSLLLAEWGVANAPSDAYFLLPARMWELLAGAIAAFYLTQKGAPFANEPLSVLGMLLIFVGVFAFDSDTPFPGLSAALPVFGTVLVIMFCSTGLIVHSLLSNRVLVGIGLISYSLYVWHQPVLAFAKYQYFDEMSIPISLALLGLSFALSLLSWRYVERPFRNRARLSRRFVFTSAFLFSVLLVSLGLFGTLKKGDLYRFSPEVMQISTPPGGILCPFDDDGKCVLGDKQERPSVLIIGDSHVSVLQQNLDRSLKGLGVSAVVFTSSWCPPFLDVFRSDDSTRDCATTMSKAFDRALGDDTIKSVILHAEWANYAQGTRWKTRDTRYFFDELTSNTSIDENKRVFERGVTRTVEALSDAGKRVIIVKSVPEYDVLLPNYLARSFERHGKLVLGDAGITTVEYSQRNEEVEQAFQKLPKDSGLAFVETFDVFCPEGQCKAFDAKNNVLYNDANHLSLYGARMLVDRIIGVLDAN